MSPINTQEGNKPHTRSMGPVGDWNPIMNFFRPLIQTLSPGSQNPDLEQIGLDNLQIADTCPLIEVPNPHGGIQRVYRT